MANNGLESHHCVLCLQGSCDVRLSCGCRLHSTCLPNDFIFHHKNTPLICPSCHTAPIESISLLPLPADKIEEASRLREQNSPTPATLSSQPSSKKRCSANPTSPMCRTGRYSAEESTFVDKIIKNFDAGLLPLPRGIKLNGFLCNLLSCRTSRLTKKLKQEKLSSRSYNYIGATCGPGRQMSFQAGVSIQRAQALFLRTLTPAWMQTELSLNMSRVWREQFEKFCLQIGFNRLDATEWNASLKNAGSLHSEDSLEAKRKRLKQALYQDVSAAAELGIAVRNNNPQELPSTLKNDSHVANQSVSPRGILGCAAKGYDGSNRKFGDEEPGISRHARHVTNSSGSLDNLLTVSNDSRAQSKASSGPIDHGAQEETERTEVVLCQEILQDSKPSSKQVDGAIDSAVRKAFTEDERNGNFLKKISSFLTSTVFNFQHCDVWVPTQYTESAEMNGQVRLVNAGHITFKSRKVLSHASKKLSEFGVYSKTFSFAPGSGLPGRVFASGQSIWMNDVHLATVKEFGLVGGAKMYGVRTAVGLHVSASIGTLVVVLYSTADIMRDITFENQCMNFFRQLNPTPKWHLSIDVSDDETKGLPQSS